MTHIICLILISYDSYVMTSVKPLKSKNRDDIVLEDTNPNLKKVVIEIFDRQLNI